MKRYFFQCFILIFSLSLLFALNGHAQFGKLKKAAGEADKEKKAMEAEQKKVDGICTKVEKIKKDFQGSTKCLDKSRDNLFNMAVTQEKKAQIEEQEKAVETAKTDEEKISLEQQYKMAKTTAIKEALESGELEKKKLSAEEGTLLVKTIHNMRLAVKKDKKVIDVSPKVAEEAESTTKEVDVKKSAAIATKVKDLKKAVAEDLPDIMKEAPAQVDALTELLSAANALRKGNNIEDPGEPSDEDDWE